MTNTVSPLQPFIDRLSLRSSLRSEEKRALCGMKGHYVEVPAHTDFVRLGEDVDHACMVMNGIVARFDQTRDGARQITAIHIRGDMADLPSVVSPRAGWALQALSPSTIFRIPHPELRRVAHQYPAIAEAFWRDCVADGSLFSQWVVNVGRRNALVRFAHLLCETAIRLEYAGLGNRLAFTLPITQADMADVLGLTAIHVNRTIQALKATGYVSIDRATIVIHQWEQLVLLADFDPTYLLIEDLSARRASA